MTTNLGKSKGLISSKTAFLICLGIPLLLLVSAYIQMCLKYRTFWLFSTIVHENGRYTFFQTIFYFRHFLWESSMKTIFSLYFVGVFFYYGKPILTESSPRELSIPNKNIILCGLIIFSIMFFSFLMTAKAHGLKESLLGFLQFRTSELRPIAYGSHWRNHFLSNIAMFSFSPFIILLYRILVNGGYWRKRPFSGLFYIGAGIFIFLTIIFGFTIDSFKTPSYLGHQLREILGADNPLTVLLALSVLIFLENKYDKVPFRVDVIERKNRNYNFRILATWAVPLTVITLFLAIKVLSLNISSEIENIGRTENWSTVDIFAWHFYEHSIDNVFVCACVAFIYLLSLKKEFKRK